MSKKVDYFSLFARLAIAMSFLSAVADRIGLWTPILGSENVVWGNMENFIVYTGVLVPWIPNQILPLLGWSVTFVEVVLGVLLIIGFQQRIVALFSGILLLTFAFSMLFFTSFKAPLDYSVFTAAACSFLLYRDSK
ncbi:DoxX protein [Bacteroides bouchesdurhonensis]|uniref:DoxX protein n=1 Tax=Bacteroides bouchesdurhonensis TaxID=1841855 RepID=UPI0011DD131F|nr:DoxX protein [Bacteroides bouchesdurhonensis]